MDLPHDWDVELHFENDRTLVAHGAKPLGRNYPATSIGWYRKVFDVPADDLGHRFTLEFDGAFRTAMVIFNNHYLGVNMSGYAPCTFDVTDFVNYGAKNVLVVRLDATLNEGWFYEGAGIYRHVLLTSTHPVHVAYWGTFVSTVVGAGSATVRVSLEVNNHSDAAAQAQVSCRVLDRVLEGNLVTQSIVPGLLSMSAMPVIWYDTWHPWTMAKYGREEPSPGRSNT